MSEDVGELILKSWLKNEKNCILVETNWQIGNFERDKRQDEVLIQFLNKANELNNELDLKTDIDKFLSQTEIDVVGKTIKDNYILAEVATHLGGLNYNGKGRSIKTVETKLVKLVLILISYFRIKNGEIVFATINSGTKKQWEDIKGFANELQKILSEEGYNIKITLLADEEFKQEIFDKIILSKRSNNLFERTVQIYNYEMNLKYKNKVK